VNPDTLLAVQYWRKADSGSLLVEEFLYEQEVKIPRKMREGEFILITPIKP
jgi:hypothetical protein